MKKLFIFLCLTWMGSTLLSAQNSTVEEAVNTLTKLLIDPEEAGLRDITLSQLSYGHSNGAVQDQKDFIGALMDGSSDFVEISYSNQQVIASGETALVRHTMDAKLENVDGSINAIKLHILTVWQEQNGKWRLLARQAVRPPQ